MTDPSPHRDESEEAPPFTDPFDEVRAAAGVVVASLKQLLDAAERVVEDPEALESMVATGKSVFEAFAAGFVEDQRQPEPPSESESSGA